MILRILHIASHSPVHSVRRALSSWPFDRTEAGILRCAIVSDHVRSIGEQGVLHVRFYTSALTWCSLTHLW